MAKNQLITQNADILEIWVIEFDRHQIGIPAHIKKPDPLFKAQDLCSAGGGVPQQFIRGGLGPREFCRIESTRSHPTQRKRTSGSHVSSKTEFDAERLRFGQGHQSTPEEKVTVRTVTDAAPQGFDSLPLGVIEMNTMR